MSKLMPFVYIPTGVTIKDRVMISAGCIFVNDKYPRAYDYKKNSLADSGPNEETLITLVKDGATLGARVTILGNVVIGQSALVGAGAVVTKSVPDYAIMVGNPARQIGWICRCGQPLIIKKKLTLCRACAQKYLLKNKILRVAL
jgi:UDP-2-acetamido-3-amino-2,3-dideoxy-glucuronate N-acetyltransferase